MQHVVSKRGFHLSKPTWPRVKNDCALNLLIHRQKKQLHQNRAASPWLTDSFLSPSSHFDLSCSFQLHIRAALLFSPIFVNERGHSWLTVEAGWQSLLHTIIIMTTVNKLKSGLLHRAFERVTRRGEKKGAEQGDEQTWFLSTSLTYSSRWNETALMERYVCTGTCTQTELLCARPRLHSQRWAAGWAPTGRFDN